MKGTPTCLLCIYFLVGRKLVNMEEIWKDIKGYEKMYQISNYGRIKSLSRFINSCKQYSSIGYYSKEKIIKQSVSKTGYYICTLCKNGKTRTFKVHRLIAEAFIDNPNNLPIINHKDGNKLNNSIDNMEWCDYSHNNKEAYKQGLKESNLKWIVELNKRKRKKVNQYDLNNNFIKQYKSVHEAENETKAHHVNIIKVCKGQRITAGGYKWRYAEEE